MCSLVPFLKNFGDGVVVEVFWTGSCDALVREIEKRRKVVAPTAVESVYDFVTGLLLKTSL